MGVFVGFEFFRRPALEILLILVQIGVADLEQLVERQCRPSRRTQLFRKGLRANAEVAIGSGQKIGLEPV